MAEVGKLEKFSAVLAVCWAVPGTIYCAFSFDGWLGPEVSSFGFFLVLLLPLVLLWLASPIAVALFSIRAGRASGAGWRVIGAWTGLACIGVALDIALLRAIRPWTGAPLPSWERLLWIGYAIAGLAMIALPRWVGRRRLPLPSPGLVWRDSRNAGLAFAGALPILAVSVPSFIAAEIYDLGSVHRVDAGTTAAMRLEPGSYDLDVGQGPAGDYSASPAIFSVTGGRGPVAVRAVPSQLSAGDWGQMFLDVGNAMPTASFTITEPGTYRVSVASNDQEGEYLISGALVADPYGVVLARTAPWAIAIVASLGVMAACWGSIRRAQRAALLPRVAGVPPLPR